MALFGPRKTGPPMGAERVLTYLTDAQRLGAPLRIEDADGHEVPATLDLLSERRVTLRAREPLHLDKGSKTHLVFILDDLRFKAPTRVLEVDGTNATVRLPQSVELAERRKVSRSCLKARDGMAAMAMAGLFTPLAASQLASPETALTRIDDRADRASSQGGPLQDASPHAGMDLPSASAAAPAFVPGMPWSRKAGASSSVFWTSQVTHWLEARHLSLGGPTTMSAAAPPPAGGQARSTVWAPAEFLPPSAKRNPFLGQGPTQGRRNLDGLPLGIAYTFMTRPLPETWRRSALMSRVNFEVAFSGNSLLLGVRIR